MRTPIIKIEMFPIYMFGYAAAAIGFYRYIYDTAPLLQEEEERQCKIYELFPEREERQEEIKKAA